MQHLYERALKFTLNLLFKFSLIEEISNIAPEKDAFSIPVLQTHDNTSETNETRRIKWTRRQINNVCSNLHKHSLYSCFNH